MAVSDGLRVTRVDQAASAVAIAYLLEPPGWTRLEPQSISGDPTPGLEARVHDPLWMLTRQWQLGEFHGQDLGSQCSSTSLRPPPASAAIKPVIRRPPMRPGPGASETCSILLLNESPGLRGDLASRSGPRPGRNC